MLADFVDVGELCGIDKRGALPLHGLERIGHDGIDGIMKAKIIPSHADFGALQTLMVKEFGVVGGSLLRAAGRSFVSWIDTRQNAEQYSCVADRPGHGAGRVLGVRNGNDAGSAHESYRRLDADDAVD